MDTNNAYRTEKCVKCDTIIHHRTLAGVNKRENKTLGWFRVNSTQGKEQGARSKEAETGGHLGIFLEAQLSVRR